MDNTWQVDRIKKKKKIFNINLYLEEIEIKKRFLMIINRNDI
jgi:hypothetical protein